MFNYKSKLGNTQLDKNITTHQLIKLIKDILKKSSSVKSEAREVLMINLIKN